MIGSDKLFQISLYLCIGTDEPWALETSGQCDWEVYDSKIRWEQSVSNCLRILHIDRILIHAVYWMYRASPDTTMTMDGHVYMLSWTRRPSHTAEQGYGWRVERDVPTLLASIPWSEQGLSRTTLSNGAWKWHDGWRRTRSLDDCAWGVRAAAVPFRGDRLKLLRHGCNRSGALTPCMESGAEYVNC
jgi:hypothetical protein